MPMITFFKKERRYRSSGSSAPRVKVKTRPLAYVSNKDGYIYSYYAAKLQQTYDDLLKELGLDEVVIGYRKGRSNISLAKSAFDEIGQRGSCSAVALDIRGFFDNISHSVLKASWTKVLGLPHLPDDHYSVLSGLTTSRGIPLEECIARLGLPLKSSYSELPRPLCSIQIFREQICGHPASSLKSGTSGYRKGIPQGTPISAIAANISMLEFDLAMLAEAKRLGGSYRRYSDDILPLCPIASTKKLETFLKTALKKFTLTLEIAPEKTSRVVFLGDGSRVSGKPLQYLGFLFDGVQRQVRSGTIARFHHRMAIGVRRAKWSLAQAKAGALGGRNVLHRRELNAKYTHLGSDSFVRGYGKRARQNVGENVIGQQLSGSSKLLGKMINRKRNR